MHALIPLSQSQIDSQTLATVNARDLHSFLAVKSEYNHWIVRRISTYGFVQDVDFAVATFDDVRNVNSPIKTIDYYLSLDMAKQLSMVERTAKGKEARQYFLECERQSQQPASPRQVTPAQTALALAQSLVDLEQRQGMIESRQDAQETALAALQAKQPPPERCTCTEWLSQTGKPYLPASTLSAFKYHAKQLEVPVMFCPPTSQHALPYFTRPTLAKAYEQATRQLSFLRHQRKA